VEGSQHQSNASLVCQRGRGCGSDHRFLAFTTAMLPCAAQSLCLHEEAASICRSVPQSLSDLPIRRRDLLGTLNDWPDVVQEP